jgi:hypothetical protein
MNYIPGIEIPIDPVRRHRHSTKPVTIPLSKAERAFMLYRMADVSRVVDAICHNPKPGEMVSPWPREAVVRRTREMVKTLRSEHTLLLIGPLEKLIVTDAIERNDYFSSMDDGDPRLSPGQAKAANALRERLQSAIGERIGQVPLGAGRARL